MKKLIFIISFLLAIQYGGKIYAETNETLKSQEEALGISGFIEETEKYTENTFSDIDLNSIYENALSGNMNTSGLMNSILKLTGKEVANTLKTLGYILIIVIIHGIIKTISDGMGNRRSRGNNVLCSIYTNYYLNYGKLFRNNTINKKYSKQFSRIFEFASSNTPSINGSNRKYSNSIYCTTSTTNYNNICSEISFHQYFFHLY